MDFASSFYLCFTLLTLVGGLLAFRQFRQLYRVRGIGFDELKAELDRQPILLDVRTLREWEVGALEGTVNEPLDSLSQCKIPKESQILVLCDSGIRAYKAAEILMGLGYAQVVYYAGSFRDLRKCVSANIPPSSENQVV